ncbi:HNH endonuclease [Streptomyces sp. NPDC059593]|uniref:HNH endonuclease n=1 Tax=Streptomyces sp. NPDC059593 TaxID=3346878 RepID=UPI00368EEAE6
MKLVSRIARRRGSLNYRPAVSGPCDDCPMDAQGNEVNTRGSQWPRPTTLPGPLEAALDVLKSAGCALSRFDLTSPELISDLGAEATSAVVAALNPLNEHHRALAGFPESTRSVVLEYAHITPWPAKRLGRSSESEARRAFNHWGNILVLCSSCHAIYDNTGLIPQSLVEQARHAVLATGRGLEALDLFLKRSLAFRGSQSQSHSPDSDVALAAYERRRLHADGDTFSVLPWQKRDRYFQSTVDTAGMIRVGAYGGHPDKFFFGYAITDVPPPEPTTASRREPHTAEAPEPTT